jgi:hypothetical protein
MERKTADLTPEQLLQAIPRLEKRIADVESFDPEGIDPRNPGANLHGLRASIDDALTRTFGPDTVEYERYKDAAYFSWPLSGGGQVHARRIIESLTQYKQQSLNLLRQAVSALRERQDEQGIPVLGLKHADPKLNGAIGSRKVFVVHGHETGPREAIARFLERAEFKVIVLHEQASQGRTIIEKFQDHADVSFAVVLLTPDDVGCAVDGTPQPRARQNVILELGYFIGRLGRKHVCAIKSGAVEVPSDILGVVWITYDDAGGWKASLAKELQAAGFDVDLNKALA